MRRKSENLLDFDFEDQGLPKVVKAFRNKYRKINKILLANPRIIKLAHKDFKRLSKGKKGRACDYTSETIFRTLIIHFVEGRSLRETVLLIFESQFLQNFTRNIKGKVMDYSFLDRCLKALKPGTIQAIHRELVNGARKGGRITLEELRGDTTVVESNIHWPTDSSLLWDSYRTIYRLIERARKAAPGLISWRFHPKKIKKLHLNITRYSASNYRRRRRTVKKWMRKLIRRVKEAVDKARRFCVDNDGTTNKKLGSIVKELKEYLAPMEKAVDVAERIYIKNEKVSPNKRVFSIFEPHTELIMRGRREKPVEFGHKLLLVETRENFIIDFDLMKKKRHDSKLAGEALDRIKRVYGITPKVFAADKGFCPREPMYKKLEGKVETLAIPRRMRDFADAILKGWQLFRAGIEGTISGLKRAFRLARCMYRGFKTFKVAVGMGIIAHNLLVLGRMQE